MNGDLATARELMAAAPHPANAGKSPSSQMSAPLLKVKAELEGVKPAPGKTPDSTTTYQVSRVNVADIAAGKF